MLIYLCSSAFLLFFLLLSLSPSSSSSLLSLSLSLFLSLFLSLSLSFSLSLSLFLFLSFSLLLFLSFSLSLLSPLSQLTCTSLSLLPSLSLLFPHPSVIFCYLLSSPFLSLSLSPPLPLSPPSLSRSLSPPLSLPLSLAPSHFPLSPSLTFFSFLFSIAPFSAYQSQMLLIVLNYWQLCIYIITIIRSL